MLYSYVVSLWSSLSLWQEDTYSAASVQHFAFSPKTYFNLSPSGSVSNSSKWLLNVGKNICLICFYFSQWSRKCCSVSTSPCEQSEQSLSSLGVQVCLCRPVSTARLCPLSLYLLRVFLSLWSDTVVRYSATAYGLFKAE